jgi:hypothetical protein
MPRFDLRKDQSNLDPLAPFKVLAVMCRPADLIERERMLAAVQSETNEGRPRRTAVSNDEFFATVRLTSARAKVAGGLLLTQLQLQEAGRSSSLNSALPLVSGLLPEWRQETAPIWSKDDYIGHLPRSRRKMLEACIQFRSVAHLWAALLHGLQHQRDDIWPGSRETLPAFLSYADCFREMALRLPAHRAGQRSAVEPWTFIVPERLRQAVRLEALPLNEEQLKVLNEHHATK